MAARTQRATETDATHSADAPAAPSEDVRRLRLQQALLAWYTAHGRDLPWRHTRDPYAVLVSEVMLQQTQVERVLPKYAEFLAAFPTLDALAAAPIAKVIRVWAPLGYNVRAVRLHQIARQARDSFAGALPQTLEGLLALKGIGRYTAGAIACFAFDLPVATVDTNIRRVLWRVFRGIEPAEWPSGQPASRDLWDLAQWALPPTAAYDWQQALMDLGATVCTVRRPACERCPLSAECAALAEVGRVTLFASGEALARVRADRARAAGRSAARVAEAAGAYTTTDATGAPRTRARQADVPFASSSRYFRGRVLAALRALAPGALVTLRELGPQVKPDWTDASSAWLRDIVRGLARDGLVRVEESGDATAPDAEAAIQVGLP